MDPAGADKPEATTPSRSRADDALVGLLLLLGAAVLWSLNGALIKFKCDVHQWMTGYVWVQNNPYFAVTGADGSFEIKDVPAGKYEIEAWHEKFGSKKGEVTIAADGTAETKFDFAATDKAAP